MKLAAISMVRDEADIIEAWARHNLHFLDQLFVIDDQSTDATVEILAALQGEGLPIALVPHAATASYYQGKSTTRLLAHALARGEWDFIFPLDADECLMAESREALERELAALGPETVAGLSNVDYLVTPEDDAGDPNPLTRIQHAIPYKERVFKVALPGGVARRPGISITDGNHYASQHDVRLPEVLLQNTRIAHFPARSREQLVAKCLSAYMRWKSRHDYNGTLAQWPMKASAFLRDEKSLSVEHFEDFCVTYRPSASVPLEKRPFRECRGTVKYVDLAAVYPYRSFLNAVDGLIAGAQVASLARHKDLLAAERAQLSPLARFFEKNFRSVARRLRGAPKGR